MIAPLSPLSPLQSLGYLEPGMMLECANDLAWRGIPAFTAGRGYTVRPFEIIIRRAVKRPAVSGPDHEHLLTGRDLAFGVTDAECREWLFVSRRYIGPAITLTAGGEAIFAHFSALTLTRHFIIPHVPDVAELNPELHAYNLKFLEEFERVVHAAND